MINHSISHKIPFKAIKVERLQRWLHLRLKRIWQESAAEFFRAASQRVVIDTGMSMASMLPLAAKVKAAKLLRQKISAQSRGPKKPYTSLSGVIDPKAKKTISKGRDAGKEALSRDAHSISFGSPTNPKLEFKFEIVVFQFHVHDGGLDGSGSWQALTAGRDAFLEQWDRSVKAHLNSQELIDWFITGKLKG